MREWKDKPLARHEGCPDIWLAASELFEDGRSIYRAHSVPPAICTGAGKTQEEAIERREELKPRTEMFYA